MEEVDKYVDASKRVFEGIECTYRDEQGAVSSSSVRKVLDIAMNSTSYNEFVLRLKYLVARNVSRRSTQLVDFHNQLLKEGSKLDKESIESMRKLMEYVVMQHAVLAKLGETKSAEER
ncbi:MAG: hypothetical protein JRJ77_07400 [Deltaproteobacteria bacterium]|nr:hypothetical protein [Deltaproteobacteria bacterium]